MGFESQLLNLRFALCGHAIPYVTLQRPIVLIFQTIHDGRNLCAELSAG